MPRKITAPKFKATCLSLLDELDPEGIVITKRVKTQHPRTRPST